MDTLMVTDIFSHIKGLALSTSDIQCNNPLPNTYLLKWMKLWQLGQCNKWMFELQCNSMTLHSCRSCTSWAVGARIQLKVGHLPIKTMEVWLRQPPANPNFYDERNGAWSQKEICLSVCLQPWLLYHYILPHSHLLSAATNNGLTLHYIYVFLQK